jgi:hypothetical protein
MHRVDMLWSVVESHLITEMSSQPAAPISDLADFVQGSGGATRGTGLHLIHLSTLSVRGCRWQLPLRPAYSFQFAPFSLRSNAHLIADQVRISQPHALDPIATFSRERGTSADSLTAPRQRDAPEPVAFAVCFRGS